MFKKFVAPTLVTLGFLLGAGALSVFADWTAAPSTPPNSNVDAPVNVGSPSQTKLGPLTLNFGSGSSIGLIVSGTIKMVDNNQAEGKVLASDANGVGTWRSLSSLSGGASSAASVPNAIQVFTSGASWTAPTGVTRVVVKAWGGGGGGGAANTPGGDWRGGGGGGGGGFAESVVTVTPGTTYTITIGAGGARGFNKGDIGSTGGDSTFGLGGTVYVRGAGGLGGGSYPTATTNGGFGGGGSGTLVISGQAGGMGWGQSIAQGGSSPMGGMGSPVGGYVGNQGTGLPTVPGGGGGGGGPASVSGYTGAGGMVELEY